MTQRSQIARPTLTLRARNNQVVVIRPVTLREGRVLSDWDTFVLTVREDPNFPRDEWWKEGEGLDPYYDSWALVLQVSLAAGAAIKEETVGLVTEQFLEFPVTAADSDLPGGFERYAADVRAYSDDDEPGETTLVDARWVTLKPRDG